VQTIDLAAIVILAVLVLDEIELTGTQSFDADVGIVTGKPARIYGVAVRIVKVLAGCLD
jgi:hypothetical protein